MEATLDGTTSHTLLSTYRYLQNFGLRLGPLFLLPVPGVDDLNLLPFQQSGNPALPPSNPNRWYRPAAMARPLSLYLKLSQLDLRALDARLLRRLGGVFSTFTNSLPTVGEHLHLRSLSDRVGIKPGAY